MTHKENAENLTHNENVLKNTQKPNVSDDVEEALKLCMSFMKFHIKEGACIDVGGEIHNVGDTYKLAYKALVESETRPTLHKDVSDGQTIHNTDVTQMHKLFGEALYGSLKGDESDVSCNRRLCKEYSEFDREAALTNSAAKDAAIRDMGEVLEGLASAYKAMNPDLTHDGTRYAHAMHALKTHAQTIKGVG